MVEPPPRVFCYLPPVVKVERPVDSPLPAALCLGGFLVAAVPHQEQPAGVAATSARGGAAGRTPCTPSRRKCTEACTKVGVAGSSPGASPCSSATVAIPFRPNDCRGFRIFHSAVRLL